MERPVTRQSDAELLRGVALFEGLTDAQRGEVIDRSRVRRVKAGAVLFRQGGAATTLFVPLEARVRVTELDPTGHEVLLRFIGPGQMLGGMAGLERATYPVTATVVDEGRVMSWSNEAMQRLLERHPRLARNTMRLMVARIRELQQRCLELATQHVEQRVARTVLRLIRQAGRRTDRGILLDLPLSRQDLAEMTGTTLFTVSRLLARWTQQEIVEVGRRRVVLRNPHALVAIADDLPDREAASG